MQNTNGWEKVNYLQFLSRKDLNQALSASSIGLVLFHNTPNHYEAQPNKLFEYMNAGLPIIASDFPLWKEIVEDNNCGICVNPLDIEAISKAIKYLLDNPEIAEKMGRNGTKAVKEKYNWTKEKQKLLALYQNLLAN